MHTTVILNLPWTQGSPESGYEAQESESIDLYGRVLAAFSEVNAFSPVRSSVNLYT